MAVNIGWQKIVCRLAEAFIAALVCCAILVWALKLWKADLEIPFTYIGDGLSHQTWAKDVVDEGWHLHNHYLSFPTEMDSEDYPQPDNLSFFMMKLLGLLTNSYGKVFNWFYLLTYPLTTLTAFAVFRRFNMSYLPSLLGSLLFTFAPYHFFRGEPHILLSAYFLVPLQVMVALWIYQGWPAGNSKDQEPNPKNQEPNPKPAGNSKGQEPSSKMARIGSWKLVLGSSASRMAASIAICLAVGAGSVYYAFFGCFLLIVAGVWGACYHRRPRLLGLALLFVVAISLSTLANLCPTFLYNFQHGKNWECVIRYPFQAEHYGFRLDNLVLPPPEFRLARYIQPAFTLGWSFGTYLGLPATGGLIILLFNLMIPRWRTSCTLMTSLSHLNLVSLLLGLTGGCGFLIAMFLAPWIRCYYRLSIFISFFAIFALVLVLEQLTAKFQEPRIKVRVAGRLGIWFLEIGILLVGMWDQTSKFFVPSYENTAAEFKSDRDFVRRIEARIPGEAVFQLPYAPFPEYGVEQMICYDHMRGFLHTRNLRWSGGVVRGRACDFWQQQICAQPVPQMLQSVILAGFKGIYIDRFGYADRAKDLENRLRAILQEEPIVSENQRLVFYGLSEYARDLRASLGNTEWEIRHKQTMAGLDIYPAWGPGFYHWEGTPAQNWRWCGPKAKMELRNLTSQPQTIQLEISFEGRGQRPAQLHMQGSLISEDFQIASGKTCTFRKVIQIPPGRHAVDLRCDGERITSEGDPREIVFRVINCRMQVLDAVKGDAVLARRDAP